MTSTCKDPHRARFSLRMLTPFLALVAAPALAQSPPPSPCSSPEHRQFDFWLGEWEVRGPAGKVAGTNRITRAHGGCVLHEQYDTGRGYSGSSFNIYDAGRGRWHQTWVDSSGLLLQLDGGLVDGRMVMEGETVGGAAPARSIASRGRRMPTAACGNSGSPPTRLASGL